jgi:hypothetical protein
MYSKTAFQSTRDIPSAGFGIGVPVLLFCVLGAVLVATYVTPDKDAIAAPLGAGAGNGRGFANGR